MKVSSNVLDRQYLKYKDEYEKKLIEVMRKGWYVLGPEVESFEKEFADYCGSKYCVGLASGLDALILAVRVLGIGKGDEVLVQGNTYIATVMGITINEATPVFVEPDEYHNIDADKIEEKITKKTKAIMVTHLYGQAANMEKIMKIAKKHKLFVIEDCAQAHGAKFNKKMVGTFGDIGCYSFYPSKNLGAFGDAGAIITNNEKYAAEMKALRNYGSEKRYHNKYVGMNSRLDEVQAALLRIKLTHLDELNKERCKIADTYNKKIKNKYIETPKVRDKATTVNHLYVIKAQHREKLMEYLKEHEIGTIVHYPIPPHLQECYKYLGHKEGEFPITEKLAQEVLTLPLYNGMTKEEQDYVIDVINKFEV